MKLLVKERVTTMTLPRYVTIAMDLAERIYQGELLEGEKVYGRSTLAASYRVSPETVRRAVRLLSEMDVVNVSDKSGIYIRSRQQAYVFLQHYNTRQNFEEIRAKIAHLQTAKMQIERELNDYLDMYMEYAMGLERHHKKDHVQIIIDATSPIINQTVASTQFWRHTNGTILSVKRDGMEYISPGPDFTFQANDELTIVCATQYRERLEKFLEQSL